MRRRSGSRRSCWEFVDWGDVQQRLTNVKALNLGLL